MATQEQHQELIDILKFVPCTYTVRIWGYGQEICVGSVQPKLIDRLRELRMSYSDFALGQWDPAEIAEDILPCSPGTWYEVDNFAHECSAEFGSATVEVEDEDGNTVWSCDLDIGSLEDQQIEVDCDVSIELQDCNTQDPIVISQSFEKGVFFESEIELRAPFDAKKFRFKYNDICDAVMFSGISYDDKELISNDYDTRGKGIDFSIYYQDGEPVKIEVDEYPDIYYPESDREYTAYFSGNVAPLHAGIYDCVYAGKTTHGKLEWTGTDWVDFGERRRPVVNTVDSWRGLNWDTSNKENPRLKRWLK